MMLQEITKPFEVPGPSNTVQPLSIVCLILRGCNPKRLTLRGSPSQLKEDALSILLWWRTLDQKACSDCISLCHDCNNFCYPHFFCKTHAPCTVI